ncbi:MAG TPA: glycosyltransferase family 4 protein [Candidatus Acidoferrum sp.]|nr:glycosyltransferase family 4 protein [Candidatus Acidoferrum sp.]
MNVALISADPEVPVFGNHGCSVHVQEILRAMSKRGFEVDLFAANYGGAVTQEFSGVRMHSIAVERRERPAERERAALANNAAVRDLLHRANRERNYSLIYERHALWNFAAMEFAREKDVPGILEINSPSLEERGGQHQLSDRAGAEDAAMRAFRSATLIRAISQQLAHILESHPSARGKVHVIKNAVNAERFAWAVPSLEREPNTFVVGFTGELRAAQGLTMLISAFQLVADALPMTRLVIVGEGEEREAIEREVAARNLTSHVKFLGGVPPHKIPSLLASFDVAVAPVPQLNGYYASPLKVFEYMAAGLPIIASRIGQIEEVLKDGATAILVPPGDKEALAQALYDLVESPDTRHRLGEAARAQALAAHSWDAALGQILELAGIRETAHRA